MKALFQSKLFSVKYHRGKNKKERGREKKKWEGGQKKAGEGVKS